MPDSTDSIERIEAPRRLGSAMLSVSVLAGFSVSVDDMPLRLANRKARALIAVLALSPGHAASRERLSGLLWSDVTDAQARGSLRQAILELRGALAAIGFQGLRAERSELALAPAEVEIDAERLIRDIAEGRGLQQIGSQTGRPTAMFDGLDDIGGLFADWLRETREALGGRLTQALEWRAADRAIAADLRREAAEALLRLDPLHEEACRVVMQAAAEAGETAAALRCYAALYERLGAEHDMEPSAATQSLVADIKRGAFDRTPTRSREAASVVPLPAGRHRDGPVVVVLPLASIGDGCDPWLGIGIAEDVVALLASVREPAVISVNSTRRFTVPFNDIAGIGRTLGADYVLSGSVRPTGGALRVSVELAEVTAGVVIWARSFSTSPDRLAETQIEIANRIGSALVPRIGAAELRRSLASAPEDLGVYHLMLRARDMMFRLDLRSLEAAGDLLRQAVTRAPGYAPLHATLCEWFTLRIFQGWSPDREADSRALAAAGARALELDPGLPRPLALLGHTRTIAEHAHEAGLAMLMRAAELAPGDPDTIVWSVPTLAYVGQGEAALETAERALRLSPDDPSLFRNEHFRGIAHYGLGQYAEAAEWGLSAMRRQPGYTSNLRFTAASLGALGRVAEAREVGARLIALQPMLRASEAGRRSAFRDSALKHAYRQHLCAAGVPD